MKGLGTDIIEIARVQNSIERHGNHFLTRIFDPEEISYCQKYNDPYPRYAGRFAAKEAIAKAFGTGFGKELSWQDIRIANDDNGRPQVFFSDRLKARFSNPELLLSISHCQTYATATAIWIK